MASRAVARAQCDWAFLIKNALPDDATRLTRTKAAFDANVTKASSFPGKLPEIDWNHYKKHADDPNLVEDIEKMYRSLKVSRPKPPESRVKELDYHHKKDKERFDRFAVYAKSAIEAAEQFKSQFEKMLPSTEMTMEDFTLTFPHWSRSLDSPPTMGWAYDRTPGLSREEAAAFAQPDPIPFATKTAWKDWEEKYKKWYQ